MPTLRRSSGIILAGPLAVAVLMASPARASDPDKPWEAGIYIVSSRYDNDSTLSDTFSGGLRGAWRYKGRHLVEATYESQHTDSNNDSTIKFDLTKWTVNFLYDLKLKKPDTKVTPLLIFGAGRMNYDNGTASDGTTLFQAGAGIRMRMNSWLALRFDTKLFHFHGDSQLIIPTNGFYGFDLNAGVSFLLGAAK
jgi:outer membrane protein with beta-barrel domain